MVAFFEIISFKFAVRLEIFDFKKGCKYISEVSDLQYFCLIKQGIYLSTWRNISTWCIFKMFFCLWLKFAIFCLRLLVRSSRLVLVSATSCQAVFTELLSLCDFCGVDGLSSGCELGFWNVEIFWCYEYERRIGSMNFLLRGREKKRFFTNLSMHDSFLV